MTACRRGQSSRAAGIALLALGAAVADLALL
jgi:hypothetical protein